MGWPCHGSLRLACGPRARVREDKTSQTVRLGVHIAGVQPVQQAHVGLTRPTEQRGCFVVWVPTLTLPWRRWPRFHVRKWLGEGVAAVYTGDGGWTHQLCLEPARSAVGLRPAVATAADGLSNGAR